MANFLRPTWEPATSYEKKGNGLAYVFVPLGQRRDVALWGGVANGSPLRVQFNDAGSAKCAATCTERTSSGEH